MLFACRSTPIDSTDFTELKRFVEILHFKFYSNLRFTLTAVLPIYLAIFDYIWSERKYRFFIH